MGMNEGPSTSTHYHSGPLCTFPTGWAQLFTRDAPPPLPPGSAAGGAPGASVRGPCRPGRAGQSTTAVLSHARLQEETRGLPDALAR
jgi:hypothetical protein